MSDAQALARVIELEDVIRSLQKVRDAVGAFNVGSYADAGAALWAGGQRDRFLREFETARASVSRIGDQIGQAIGDCKSKQLSLASSINPLEHPMLSTQAYAIALT